MRKLPWKSGLKIILGLISFIVILTSILFTLIFFYPEKVWKFTSRYFLPSDLKITWESVDFTNEVNSFFLRKMHLNLENVKINKENPKLNVELANVDVKWELKPPFLKDWLLIQNFKIIGSENSWFEPSNTQAKVEEELNFYQQVQNYIGYLNYLDSYVTIHSIDVIVPNFELRSEVEFLNMQFKIKKNVEELQDDLLQANIQIGNSQMHVAWEALINLKNLGQEEKFILSKGHLKTKSWSLESDLNVTYYNDVVYLYAKPLFIATLKDKTKPLQAQSDLKIKLTMDNLDVDAKTNLLHLPGPIVKINDADIKLKIPLTKNAYWSDEPAKFQVSAPVDLFLIDKNMRRPIEKSCKCKLPEVFQTQVEGQAWLEKLTSRTESKSKALSARFSIESINNKLFSADVAAGVELYKEGEVFLYEPNTNTRLVVHSFQGLREFLDAKGILIPAPFNVLEGTLQLTAEAPLDQDSDTMQTDIKFDVDLTSTDQKVLVYSNAKLNLTKDLKRLDLNKDLPISSLKLQLPPLDPIFGVPALAADNRFLRKPPSVNNKESFQMNVTMHARTETDGAIQLLFKYAKPYIPVTLDLKTLPNEHTQAHLKLEPFVVEYLRRKIEVENLLVKVGEDERAYPLDARFHLNQGGYEIFLDLAGTVQEPLISLSSEPYLPEKDIISVLLYGRVSDQLVSNEAEAAGGVNAAIADRAIGLFGLWAFATTPIQSFSYNPVTKVYMATVSLRKGLTAGVGTNWEQAANLELRKRISTRWVLTASWTPDGSDKEGAEKLVLRWERRF